MDGLDEDTIELLGAMLDEEDELGFDGDLAGYDIDEDGEVVGGFNFGKRFKGGRRSSSRGRRRGRKSSALRTALVRKLASSQVKKTNYMNAIMPVVPGVPAAGARNFPLGFGTFTFVNGGVTAVVLTANPQRPFKGARLVVDIRRSAAALAELVTITSLNIGQNNQLVSAAALPAEAFRPDGFGTELSLDPATPGIDITLGLAISAPPAVGETISISAMIIGDTIG